jgi:multiple sugar transport system permease protein
MAEGGEVVRGTLSIWLDRIFHIGSLFVLTVFSVFPFLGVISTALKRPLEVYSTSNYLWPKEPTLQNFVDVLTKSDVPRSFGNSWIVGISTTLLALTVAVLAGYGLSRFRFPGRDALSMSILLGQMVPQAVLLVPLFVLLNMVGLIDTLLGLSLSYLTISVPLSVWMMRGYFTGIPRELEEAAMVDGCSRLGALIRIVLPLARPGIVATALYIFTVTWQEYLYALSFSNSLATRTLAVQLSYFSDEITVNWGQTMAASLLMALPCMLVFLLLHKHFVRGLTEGGVKA